MSSLPFKVKAVFEYTSPHDDDLHFPNGQIITVTEEEDDDWYAGEYVDATGVKQEGIFPRNFVEKYEPTAPPRPTRGKAQKKDAEPSSPITTAPKEQTQDIEPEAPADVQEPPPPAPVTPLAPKIEDNPAPVISAQRETSPPPAVVKATPAPAPASSSSKPPPPDKPVGSFKDRLALFNKAAPPPAPFKPGGLGSGSANNFVKKQYIAPPPSSNAYVPVPRPPPPSKVYRREEDPEIAAKESENQELAERAGLSPISPTHDDANTEEQPKPTSLKDRIALLQKQQMEQANRHADAAQKKEKPRRPPKKRTDSSNGDVESDGAPLERQDTQETAGKPSMDSVREERTLPQRNKSISQRDPSGNGNDADLSGAGEMTEDAGDLEDSKERPNMKAPQLPNRAPAAPLREPDVGEEEGAVEEEEPEAEEEEEEEEEDDIDPEVRRKEELRARMAKMSGGMGMGMMFGNPMPAPAPPRRKKSVAPSEREEEQSSPRAPPVPMIPLPGMSKVRSHEESRSETSPITSARAADEVPDVEDAVPFDNDYPLPASAQQGGAPPIPGGRPAPPPVPLESRPAVPPLSHPVPGEESDEDVSSNTGTAPAAEGSRALPRPSDLPGSPLSPQRNSYFTVETTPTSPTASGVNRRTSRMPPIPGAAPPQSRAPPPPVPSTAPLSRTSTGDYRSLQSPALLSPQSEKEDIYEADYDTDIASAEPHKDALRALDRDAGTEYDGSVRSPPPSAPRAIPPPFPVQLPPRPSADSPRAGPISRQSADMPRAAPPPPPPTKAPAPWQPDDDYDPYNPQQYTAPSRQPALPPPPMPSSHEDDEEDLYEESPTRSYASPPLDRAMPQSLAKQGSSRQSAEASRSTGPSRRSTDLTRMSMETGFVANDVDLSPSTRWWAQPNGIPPVFQNRNDILFESEDLPSKKRDGTLSITKEVFVLFQDYSQTIITAQFDAKDVSDVKMSQRHEQPPTRLRQDQLEQAHEQYGRKIIDSVLSKKEVVVGDGTPQGLIAELLKPLPGVLLPVGRRAYGALVYANLANASTQQNDEIRPGDIITFRNTKFQGKHGSLHAKYTAEVGKPDHVGVVAEWDGTKKKVRAWEQGRESKKNKIESFKLDDLRSGEVKIWRVMPRSWVGWQGAN